MLRKLQLIIVCCCIVTIAWSQKGLTKAQRHFELKSFDSAIQNAKNALETKPDCIECHYIVAESFRLMNQNVDASIWYRKMEKFDDLPQEYFFNYGQLMKKMGQYDKAITYFNKYGDYNKDLAVHYVESCEFAKAVLSEEIDFELNLYSASSINTDFGASIFKDNLVFSSFRQDFKRNLEAQNESLIQPRGAQLFIGGMDRESNINALNFLLHENEETYDMGPVHYASDNTICVITKNNFKDGEQQIFSDDLELTLFFADVENDGSFHNLRAYPFNEVGYATGFGTLNAKGDILYFASNRPGGFGGFDIYVSYFKDGEWTYPENLGSKINSSGNEVTPYFDGEQLYFSSDYHKGLGGLDVFKSHVYNGSWTYAANMGNGINSPEDDFYFVNYDNSNSSYVTSNRMGGRGSYDIYMINQGTIESEIQEVSYEDVAPAEVNIDNDVVESFDQQAEFQTVKLEEESIIDSKSTIATIKEKMSLNTADETENIETVNIESEDLNSLGASHEHEVAHNTSIPSVFREEESDATTTGTLVTEEETDVVDFSSILPPKAESVNSNNSRMISLAGAKRVSFGEVIYDNTNVYFIQLAALFKSAGNIDNFTPLKQFGSLYKMKHTNSIKVKLGYFMDESQAKRVLSEVKNMGYSDAFITYESLNTGRLELVELSEKTTDNYAWDGYQTNETTGVNFKVRLASYEDPIWFDFESVKDLGIIEQWSKNQWTIFILSGFKNLDEAQKIKLIAQNRGFKDAEIVLDKNGILEKFK